MATMVSNLRSPRTGNKVANQFAIETSKGLFFQSYDTMIAHITNDNEVHITEWWDYSATTRKYFYQFMYENTQYKALNAKEVRNLIKCGTFKVVRNIAV